MGEKVPFTKCLLHETKEAYTIYMRLVGVVAGICVLAAIVVLAITEIKYDGVAQFILVIPWWVDAICLIMMPPGIYSILVCISRRLSRESIAMSGILLIMMGVAGFIIAMLVLNGYFAIFSGVIGVIGFLLMND